jgi:glycosyltransferase involved in cell wall biosynthesis
VNVRRDIVINGRFLDRPITGVERYGREILRVIGSRCRVVQPRRRLNGRMGHLWEQFVLPRKISSVSVLWSPANTGPIMIQNQALTILDLSPLEHPEWFLRSFSAWYRLFLPLLARQVRQIFVPSNHMKQEVTRRFGVHHVRLAPGGVNTEIFFGDARPTKYDLPARYILFVGSLQPRKNLGSLLRAWGKIQDEYPDTWLIIAGGVGSVFRGVALPLLERVQYLGYVDDTDLPGLYANATLFVLPSLDEGFGLPALEAMACGTPVIVSDAGALPEVTDDAAIIFKLSEPDGLANAMRECLSDERLRLSLIEKGAARARSFSWATTAELVWESLNEI